MTIKDVKELIALVSKANLAEFKYKDNDFELTIRSGEFHKTKAVPVVAAAPPVVATPPLVATQPVVTTPVAATVPTVPAEPSSAPAPAASAVPSAAESTGDVVEIKSPMVGTFYRASGPDKPPFVKVGDVVDEKTTVCIIEAMKLFNEIEAEVKGRIVKVLVEDATPVEYGQPLFLVNPKV